MIDPIVAYFGGERAGALVLLGIGAVAIEVAVTVWRKSGTDQAKAAAVMLVLVAAIQLATGGAQFVRAPRQQAQVAQAMQQRDLQRLRSHEIPRVLQITERLAIHRWVEAGLLVFGVGAVTAARKGSRLRGAGAGLAPQAALMLLVDHLAEQRAEVYLAWLRSL